MNNESYPNAENRYYFEGPPAFEDLGNLPAKLQCDSACISRFGKRSSRDVIDWKMYEPGKRYPWGAHGKKFNYCAK